MDNSGDRIYVVCWKIGCLVIAFVKINKIELIEIHLPLVSFFETSFGRTYDRRIILARVKDDSGAEGWGECTAGESPSYSEEWTNSCWEVLEKILAPMLIAREVDSAAGVWRRFENVRVQ